MQVLECPHLALPSPHNLDASFPNGRGNCRVCGGSVRECGTCRGINRGAALYCHHCGRSLADSVEQAGALLPPGEIRESVIGFRADRALLRLLGVPADAQPFLWLKTGESGILVFTQASNQSQVWLSLIELPDASRGRLISDKMPALDDWVAAPVVNRHGLFVATAHAIHAWASHGYGEHFAHHVWTPPSGQTVSAIAGGTDYTLRVLTRDDEIAFNLFIGNGQSPAWRLAAQLEMRPPPASHVWIGTVPPDAVLPGASSGLWVLAGDALSVFDEVSGRRLLQVAATLPKPTEIRGRGFHWGYRQRLITGLFEPVMCSAPGREAWLVFPMAGASVPGAGVINMNNEARARRLDDFDTTDWLAVDQGGVLLCRGETLVRFQDGQKSWEYSLGGRLNAPPVLTSDWMLTLTERSAPGGASLIEFQVLVSQASNTRTPLRPVVRSSLEGRPLPGLPPILVNGLLLMALVPATAEGSRNKAEPVLRVAPVTARPSSVY